ncbi:unnamed protein product [Malassezia sympodialis ATCC 42132]|uniref:Uncharacterized protein n=1 Tax=Malassezia sympodialis (strain ATCC 42132) TaxID=1230383 RepID=M5EP76_MALS4|nr:uncharacterized protein MSY001_2215 [Malassezia sympodialis ATCC 42132]CCU99509.1 unnamed protein product [Malassezia sympodialis ATCC 42132]SHO78209.1 Hypothetical protein MSYG_2551 [Malassezia sympodialis ATCC 42132]|eukprot:XP_018740752.1 uncharacterized protein MSY001_2215 [Malassezia sympodialis ATCC 42132]
MTSPYSFKPGGALKLKGEKPRKRKSSTSNNVQSSLGSNAHIRSTKDFVHESHKGLLISHGTTKAEQKFEEVQRRRARLEARKTHKEKVDTFNKYLDSLSEHHDMPRIGPG